MFGSYIDDRPITRLLRASGVAHERAQIPSFMDSNVSCRQRAISSRRPRKHFRDLSRVFIYKHTCTHSQVE